MTVTIESPFAGPGSESDADPASLVMRAFVILGAFRSPPVLGVSELARRTGIPRTTVHRLASQLLEVGALSRVGSRFRLGPTFFELGNFHYPPKMHETLQPYLDDLQHLSGADVATAGTGGSVGHCDQAARARNSPSRLVKLGMRSVPDGQCAHHRRRRRPRPCHQRNLAFARTLTVAGQTAEREFLAQARSKAATPFRRF